MNHDPKTASQTKKATYSVTLFSFGKLRGKDLNLRPLGYEGKSNLNTNQENAAKPTLRK
jgi:hypothetical protein